MERFDRIAFGQFIRSFREKKGLKQGELVDDTLTQSDLSKIENGKSGVSTTKIKYLLSLLQISTDQLDHYRLETAEPTKPPANDEYLSLKLASIETIIALVGPDPALAELRHLEPVGFQQVIADYLKGKSYYFKQNWNRAHKHLFDAIQLLDSKYSDQTSTNYKAACYHFLSGIEYAQNRFSEALHYSKQAYSFFEPDGERIYLKHLILVSQAIYLQKMDRLEDALNLLDEMKVCKNTQHSLTADIPSTEAVLNMLDLQARIQNKWKMNSIAIKKALQGIELARVDKMYNRSAELWTTLGKAYRAQNKLDMAKCCFLTALQLKEKITAEYLLAYVYCQLAMLYTKQNEFALAEQNFSEAIRYSRQTNDPLQETEARMNLGQCYLQQGKNKKAHQQLERALKLATLHGLDEQKDELLLLIGNYLHEQNDPQYKQYMEDYFFSRVSHTLGGGEQPMTLHTHVNNRSIADPPMD